MNMERLKFFNEHTLIPIGSAIAVAMVVIGVTLYLSRNQYSQEEAQRDLSRLEFRLEKVEELDIEQNKQIQDIRANSLVFTEVVKQINEKLDGLKKSIDRLESR